YRQPERCQRRVSIVRGHPLDLPAVPPLGALTPAKKHLLALMRRHHRRLGRQVLTELCRGYDPEAWLWTGCGLGPAQHQRSLAVAGRVQPVRHAGILEGDHRAETAVGIEPRLPA